MNVLQSSFFYWCLALVCVVPLAIVFLNESIDRSRRGKGTYSDLLTMIRDVILPLLVLVIMLRYVFVVSEENLPTRFLSTAFWLVLMLAVFRLTRTFIGSGNYSAEDWRSLVPHMFLRLPPYTIMGFIIFHIIQNLWSFPVREMATTLGIGSIVIAFALQDTLSNLVSGVLLVANSPFKTGDWVHVGDVEGRISAVNWRYTNIETWSGDLVVIPNGAISGDSIENHSRPDRTTAITQRFNLSFEHPPNKIRDLFAEVFTNTPGILATPEPSVVVVNIDDPAMEYEAEFWIGDYAAKPDVHAEFMSRMWYALQRHRISLPTPLYQIHNYNGVKYDAEQQQLAQAQKSCLDWLPHFSQLPAATRNSLADASTYKPYAESEIVVNQWEPESGLCVIISGSVCIQSGDESTSVAQNEYLHAGDFFGETGLFGRATSPATIITNEDSDILCIPHDLINDTINRHPAFASSISAIIDQRRARKEPTRHPQTPLGADTTLPFLNETGETS